MAFKSIIGNAGGGGGEPVVYTNVTSVPALSKLGNSTTGTHNAQALSLSTEDGFIGTLDANIFELADFANTTAGADVTTAFMDAIINAHLTFILRGGLHLSDQGLRSRIKLRLLAGREAVISSPLNILPFTDVDLPTELLRNVPGGGAITNFYNGDTTSKALTNLYQPAIMQSLASHYSELLLNNNPGSSNAGSGYFGPRAWLMLVGGGGFSIGNAGTGTYVDGETLTIPIGNLKAPFAAATFSVQVTAGNPTGVTLLTAGVYPGPPKILRKMWGDPTAAWANPVTGGPTWNSLVTAGFVTKVFDASGNYITTGGSGSGLTIAIADDTTAWTPDFSAGNSANLFQGGQVSSILSNIRSENCGVLTDGTYGPMRAYFLGGLNHYIESIETVGGYYGVHFTGTDIKADKMHLDGGFCSFKQFSGGNNHCPVLLLDTPTDHYAEIDHTQGHTYKGRCLNNGNNNLTGSYAFQIGNNGSNATNQVYDCVIDMSFFNAGNSTGIPAFYMAYMQGCSVNGKITNIDTKTGAASLFQISSFATFGAGMFNNNRITGQIDGVFGQIYAGTLPQCYFNIWDAEVPLVYGSITATITGTATNNDTITLTFTNVGISGWPKTAVITITTAETTTQMATAMAAAINAASTLTNFGVSATSSANVVTIFESGSQANNTVVTSVVGGGGGTEIVTLSNAGAISGATSGGTFKTGGVYEMVMNGVPTSGTTQSTGLNKAIEGSTVLNSATGIFYVNQGSASNPLWVNNGITNAAISVTAATTVAGDTSGLTYLNGAAGIDATFTGAINTAITIDGFTFTATGQSLLVKNDTQSPSGAFNGVYTLTQIQTVSLPPIFTRATDYNQPSEINGTGAIAVISGTVNANTSWLQTSTIVAVGTTALTFVQFTYPPSSVQSGVFASKPASPKQGQQYFATDLGTNGVTIIYSGTIWKPLGGVAIIYQSGVQTTMTSTQAGTNVQIVTVPVNLVSANGGLRVTSQAVKVGAAGTAVYIWRYSAISGGANGTLIYTATSSTASKLSQAAQRTIWNRGSQTSQVSQATTSAGQGESTNTGVTASINSGSTTYINFTAQVAVNTDTAGYDAITVEWLEA